jgi:truncated hemoglobin YjbI
MRSVTAAVDERVRQTAISLFDRIGGRGSVAGLVEHFERRLASDAELAVQLAPMGAAALSDGLTAFLTDALGGPVADASSDRPTAPLSVWLDAEPFTRVVAHLWVTLLDLDVSTDLRDEVVVAIVLRALDPASA